MRTAEEVNFAFSPVSKLTEVQKQEILKTEMGFKDLATDLVALVPESPDRTVALRKLLEAKMMMVQAITHVAKKGAADVKKEMQKDA